MHTSTTGSPSHLESMPSDNSNKAVSCRATFRGVNPRQVKFPVLPEFTDKGLDKLKTLEWPPSTCTTTTSKPTP